jgi:hypothetical protein
MANSTFEGEAVEASGADWTLKLWPVEQGVLAVAELSRNGVLVSRLVGSIEPTSELAVLALRPRYERYQALHPEASRDPPWEPVPGL